MGKLAQVLEARLSLVTRKGRLTGLCDGNRQPSRHAQRADGQRHLALGHGRTQPCEEAQQAQAGRQHHPAVALQKAQQHVGGRARPCADRALVEVGAQVRGQRLHAGVAQRGLLAQGLHQDVVQVAGQARAQHAPGWVSGLGITQPAGPHGLFLQHAAGRLHGGGGATACGPRSGEQLVEHDAQAVDVGGRRHRLAAHLLRARIVRRVRTRTPEGGQAIGAFQGVQGLGDAEVQQLDLAVIAAQHVAGLEVTVHETTTVGMGHGIGQLQKQLQPVFQRSALASTVQRLPEHPLHHEVGQPVSGAPGIQQPGDVRVRQLGQRLPLLCEARKHRGGVHAPRSTFTAASP